MCGYVPAGLDCSLSISQSKAFRTGRPSLILGPGARSLLERSVTAYTDPPVQSLRTFSRPTASAPAGTCRIAPSFAV